MDMEDGGKCQSQLLLFRSDFLNDAYGLKELHGGNHISQYSYQEVEPAIFTVLGSQLIHKFP